MNDDDRPAPPAEVGGIAAPPSPANSATASPRECRSSGFHGESSRWRHGKQQELQERLAAISVWRLESYLDWQAARARAQAYSHKFMARQKEITLKHRGDAEAALIYLITHAGHGAAKVGIGDMAGSRLAQHRREGWQLLVAFQVTAKAARSDRVQGPQAVAPRPRPAVVPQA